MHLPICGRLLQASEGYLDISSDTDNTFESPRNRLMITLTLPCSLPKKGESCLSQAVTPTLSLSLQEALVCCPEARK